MPKIRISASREKIFRLIFAKPSAAIPAAADNIRLTPAPSTAAKPNLNANVRTMSANVNRRIYRRSSRYTCRTVSISFRLSNLL